MNDCDIPGKCPFCGEHTYCVNARKGRRELDAPHASGAAPQPPTVQDEALKQFMKAHIRIRDVVAAQKIKSSMIANGHHKQNASTAIIEFCDAIDEAFKLVREPALAAPATGKRNLDYSQDLRHDLRDEEFALQYILACAKEGEATLKIGLRELRAALAAADEEGGLQLAAHVEEVLTAHFLHVIECDHNSNRDKAACGCGWTSEYEPSVGHAVRAWAKHAISLMDLSAAPPPREREAGKEMK